MNANDILQWLTLVTMVVTSYLAVRRFRGEQHKTEAEASEKISLAWEKYVGPLREDLARAMVRIGELEARLADSTLEQARLRGAFEYLTREVEAVFPEAVKRAREIAGGEAQ